MQILTILVQMKIKSCTKLVAAANDFPQIQHKLNFELTNQISMQWYSLAVIY